MFGILILTQQMSLTPVYTHPSISIHPVHYTKQHICTRTYVSQEMKLPINEERWEVMLDLQRRHQQDAQQIITVQSNDNQISQAPPHSLHNNSSMSRLAKKRCTDHPIGWKGCFGGRGRGRSKTDTLKIHFKLKEWLNSGGLYSKNTRIFGYNIKPTNNWNELNDVSLNNISVLITLI